MNKYVCKLKCNNESVGSIVNANNKLEAETYFANMKNIKLIDWQNIYYADLLL